MAAIRLLRRTGFFVVRRFTFLRFTVRFLLVVLDLATRFFAATATAFCRFLHSRSATDFGPAALTM